MVPHEAGRGVYWNDEIICAEICKRTNRKEEAVRVISDKYDPSEIKGLVGRFDVMVSWKLHGAIIATSSLVPTIALSYGDKFDDLFHNQLRLPELLVDMRTQEPESLLPLLKQTFNFTWQNKESITAKLAAETAKLREFALSYSQLVSQRVNGAEIGK